MSNTTFYSLGGSTTALNGIAIQFSTGTIATGIIRIYAET